MQRIVGGRIPRDEMLTAIDLTAEQVAPGLGYQSPPRRPPGLRASAASDSPRVDEGPRPDGQEREERHEDVGARLTERERIGRGGSGGSPGQRHPEGEPDRPLHGLTVVELPDPREYSRQHHRDDLAPAPGRSPLPGI